MKLTSLQIGLAFLMAGMLGTATQAQIQVESGLSIEYYVNEVLLGGTGIASNITYLGGSEQIGYLTGSEEAFGFDSGLLMSSDVAQNVSCPNDFIACEGCLGGAFNDPDLLAVANSVPPLIGQSFSVNSVNDGSVLEFDFVAGGDLLSLEFVFGSDEYETWINTQYNDVFACFLSGPGISGTYMSPAGFPDGAKNIAVIPGSDPELPITISTVNPNINDSLYIPNQGGLNPCINGYTANIIAEQELICGETYHMKLAIADGSDTALESVLIVREGSFESGAVAVESTLTMDVGGGAGSVLYEDCGSAELTFSRTEASNLEEDHVVYLLTTGEATNGVDYGQLQTDGSLSPLPDSVVIAAGIETVVLDLIAAIDGIEEGEESVHLQFSNILACTSGVEQTIDFSIGEEPDPLQVFSYSTTVCSGIPIEIGPIVQGGYGNYTFDWSCPEGQGEASLTIAPEDDWSCFVTVGDTCGLANNTVDVEVFIDVWQFPELTVEINESSPLTLGCNENGTITSSATGGDGSYTYAWSNQDGSTLVPNLNDPSQLDLPFWSQAEEVFVSVIDGCGYEAQDSIEISYDLPPIVISVETLVEVGCDVPFTITATAEGNGPFNYQWYDEATFLGGGATLNWQVDADATIVLEVSDNCGQTASIEIVVDTDCFNGEDELCAFEQLGEDGYIPDVQGTCLTSSVMVATANEGELIESAAELVMFVNMEHSFMGDLTITYTCPNGQSVDVHQQGGGGTNLGVPDQADGTGPGVGWNYFWTATNSNGTWAENFGPSLPSGTYESAQTLTSLLGCPINGEWSIQVCDSWGADDGYLFAWGVDFGTCSSALGCTDSEACNYDDLADFDDGSCTYPGCMDALSCNYDPTAGCDDGSCFPSGNEQGCMDESACNYDPDAVCPDDSCIYPLIGNDCEAGAVACDETTTWNVELQRCECAAGPCLNDCPSDLNGNGLVEVTDLLLVLGDFGMECPE